MSKMKIGLEIHQQLEHTTKLFCLCAARLHSEDTPDLLIRRRFNLISGAYDQVDQTLFSQVVERPIEYRAVEQKICLIERDEQPPLRINPDAWRTALMIGMMFDCAIVRSQRIMRKIIVDGSLPSGFQRTILLGFGGTLKRAGKDYQIERIFLEEDSGRRLNEQSYALDRVGIPLLEIVTAPTIRSPEEAIEVAQAITETIFFVPGVARHLGAVRQDLNLSTDQFPRCELKGIGSLTVLRKAIEREVERQHQMISLLEQIEIRGDQIRLLRSPDPAEKRLLHQLLLEHDPEQDPFLFELVEGAELSSSKLVAYLETVRTQGDTRQVQADGSSVYLRKISSRTRMYPETDLTVLDVSEPLLDQIRSSCPLTFEQAIRSITDQGVGTETARSIVIHGLFELYERLVASHSPLRVTNFLLNFVQQQRVRPSIETSELFLTLRLSVRQMQQAYDRFGSNPMKIIEIVEMDQSNERWVEIEQLLDLMLRASTKAPHNPTVQKGQLLRLVIERVPFVDIERLVEALDRRL